MTFEHIANDLKRLDNFGGFLEQLQRSEHIFADIEVVRAGDYNCICKLGHVTHPELRAILIAWLEEQIFVITARLIHAGISVEALEGAAKNAKT